MTTPAGASRTILHVDMDAFYASVEQRDDPKLRGGRSSSAARPGAASCSRPRTRCGPSACARRCRWRRRSAARRTRSSCRPGATATRRRAPQVFAIFRRYTPLVEPLSLDEAFLDVTASRALFGDGEAIARAIKRDVQGELHLTASAGVAPCKFAAKIASDLRKPDGLVVVPPDGVAAFLAPLPVERMWGVGPKTAPKMRELGFATIGDLARAPTRARS